MGIWASLVLLKAADFPPSLADYEDDLTDAGELAQGWRLLSFDGTALAEQGVTAAPVVAAWSGAPTLVLMIIDSDVLLTFAAHDDELRELVIPLPRDPEMARAGLTGTPAAEALSAWADSALLQVDRDAVERMATTQHFGAFGASAALDGMLTAFGLRQHGDEDGL